MLPTPEQLETIKRFFESRALDPKCSICGAGDWAVEDIIPPGGDAKTRVLRIGAPVPLAQLECRGCGHVVFFNAATLGLDGPGE